MKSSKKRGTLGALYAVCVVVLVVVLALLVAACGRALGAGRRGGAVRGGDEADASPAHHRQHHLGHALHAIRLKQMADPDFEPMYPPEGAEAGGGAEAAGGGAEAAGGGAEAAGGGAEAAGGGAEKKRSRPPRVREPGSPKARAPRGKKPWTEYKTWEALKADKGATADYFADLNEVAGLELDWARVREDLADVLYDDREWAGRISYVDGELRVVEKVSSPYAVGEGPLESQASAMVPAELMATLEEKPALFIFHTHPGEMPGSAYPSPVDMMSAMKIAYSRHFAGEVVVSPYGVFLYGPDRWVVDKIWRDADPADPKTRRKAALAMARHNADLLGAFEGSRSWVSPWSLDEYADMAARYGVDYCVFPTDKYTRQKLRMVYTSFDRVDYETLHDYHAHIQELEKELANLEQGSAEKGAGARARRLRDGASRRVRFNPRVDYSPAS
jgi:hypothetical protein